MLVGLLEVTPDNNPILGRFARKSHVESVINHLRIDRLFKQQVQKEYNAV